VAKEAMEVCSICHLVGQPQTAMSIQFSLHVHEALCAMMRARRCDVDNGEATTRLEALVMEALEAVDPEDRIANVAGMVKSGTGPLRFNNQVVLRMKSVGEELAAATAVLEEAEKLEGVGVEGTCLEIPS
jgi:hypothetical protein